MTAAKTDIAERLRAGTNTMPLSGPGRGRWHHTPPTPKELEAASEIERLRGEIAALTETAAQRETRESSAEVDRLRHDVYNLARLATQGSERDVQLYVNRIAHRNRSTEFGQRIRPLITWQVIGLR